MKFFDQKHARKRQSLLLLVCFLGAMAATGIVIHLVIGAFSVLLGETHSVTQPSKMALGFIFLVWLTILLGAFFRALDVREGATALAKKFGAVRVSETTRSDQEQLLLNVVAEMSIASSNSAPAVYVLRREQSINAFVLGYESTENRNERYALVVSQGALDSLSRDELQAIVAHEMAHIANGDIALNMHMLIALSGLMAIDEVGLILSKKNDVALFYPGKFVGYLLRALGSIGVFFGQLVRSAFSRQREYLADATAVQFTRYPYALASALNVVKEQDHEPALHGHHAQELVHLCFQSPKPGRWIRALLASHPATELRIEAIDPYFENKKRKAKQARRPSDSQVTAQPGNVTGIGVGLPKEAATSLVLSDSASILLSDVNNCIAVLFAIFASSNANKRQDYLSAASFAFDASFSARIKQLLETIPEDLTVGKLATIEHASKIICESLNHDKRAIILAKLEKLQSVTSENDLMAYAGLQFVRSKLDLEFPVVKNLAADCMAEKRHVKAFDAMGREFALLLSMMIESSGASQAVLDQEFERVLKCYTGESFPRRSKDEEGVVDEVAAAFQTLYAQPIAVREAFVQHCVEIVRQDGYIADAEQALLDLFAASLGCEQKAA